METNIDEICQECWGERIIKTDTDIIYWDLRKGIPFADGSYDVVYH
ncbi:hypothetical protein LCGC14_3133890, partial [marine sediment metagenome]